MIRALTVLFALFLGGIIYLADKNTLPAPLTMMWRLPYGDKIGHFVMLGTLATLAGLSLKGATWRLGRWRVLWGSTIVAALITLEEFSQAFIPHRTFDLVDLSANYAGIFCAGFLVRHLARRWWPQPSQEPSRLE